MGMSSVITEFFIMVILTVTSIFALSYLFSEIIRLIIKIKKQLKELGEK